MKLVLTTALTVGFLCSGAMAATVEFRGAACLTTVTPTCPASGWVVGDCMLLRYSPPGLGTNGITTEISLLGQSFGDNYSLPTGSLIGTVLKPVNAYHVGRTGYKYASTMRITRQTPSPVKATTPFLTMVGNITNFSNSPNCNVGFRASAALRP